MAVITFPSTPTLYQPYTVGSKTWIWNGYAWDLQLANTSAATSLANSAYGQANVALSVGQAGFTQANLAFTQANTALTVGQSVFTKANSSITLGSTPLYLGSTNTTVSGLVSLRSNSAFIGITAAANTARYPNAAVIVSNTVPTISQSEFHNIGLISEGVAHSSDPNIYGVGIYGKGYTSATTRSGGVVGEGHVSAATDVGSSVGVRGYSNDTHTGGHNIGLYGDASGASSTGSNYALYLNNGGIYSATAQTWVLNGALTFSGAYNVNIPNANSSTVNVTTLITTPNIKFSIAGNSTYLAPASTANAVLTLSSNTGTLISTGDTGTVSGTMIADGSISNIEISTTAAISTSKLASNTISGVYLGNNLNALTFGTGLNVGTYNGSGAVTLNANTSSTTLAGIVQLTDSVTSTSTTTAATPNSVKIAYDLATAAYTRANVETLAQTAFAQANTSYIVANSAYNTANTKFASSGGTISGAVTINSDLTVAGNVYISGNTTSISANNLTLDDSLIYLANNNPANINDIGIVGHFTSTRYQHTGLVRDAHDSVWKLFSNVVNEFSNNTIDFSGAIYDTLKVGSVIGDLYGTANTATTLTITPGASGNVLTSNGTSWVSLAPAAGGGGVTSFSAGTTGFTPSTATTGAITLAGTLALANGGTSAALTAVQGGVAYSGASALAISAAGTANQVFVSNGTAAPTFASFDLSIHAPDSSYKKLCRVATTGFNITLSGGAPNTLDGISLALFDRILVKDQIIPAQNGIYYVTTLGAGTTGTWTRTTDADAASDIDGSTVAIGEGATNGGKRFQTTWKTTDTLGTTSMYWNKLVDVLASNTAPLQTTAVGLDIATPTDRVVMDSGAVTDLVLNSFGARALAANAASTYTRASTVYIPGAPTASSNVTIGNTYSLYVASGAVGVATSPTNQVPALALTGTPNNGAGSKTGVLGVGPNFTAADKNIMASFVQDINDYTQIVVQNPNAGTTASADFIVNNDNITGSGIYGDFGINSSAFSGTGSFNQKNAIYLYANGGDLVLGTQSANNIKFVVNSGVNDAFTINTSGALAANGSYGTAGQVLTTQGSGAVPTWTTVSGGGGGLTTTDDNATNATYYPVFVTAAGGSTAKTGSTGLQYNPSTGTLSATIFNSLSDQTKKDNIITISNATNTVKKIDGVEFDWKDNGKHSSGVIAQQLEQILPHLVNENADGIKSVNYSGLIGYLIESVKELSARVEELENR